MRKENAAGSGLLYCSRVGLDTEGAKKSTNWSAAVGWVESFYFAPSKSAVKDEASMKARIVVSKQVGWYPRHEVLGSRARRREKAS